MQINLPQAAARDRRFQLLVACSCLSLVLGLFAFSSGDSLALVARTGYWFELAAFLVFLWALWGAFREELSSFRWRSLDWPLAGLVGVCGTVLLVHEVRGFKVLMDEVLLLGTSMNMHFNREALAPLRGNDIQGAYVLMDGAFDKHPLFFPFLLSVVHDLTGYRPGNAFLLNGLLGYVFLGLSALLGRLLAGRSGAWLSVLLFAGLPLLGQNAVGGGLELLNLVLILATVLLGVRLLSGPSDAALTAFCYAAVLLCQVRYESILVAAPVLVLVLWLWRRERRVVMTWSVAVAPLLLLPLLLQRSGFGGWSVPWDLGPVAGSEALFSLGNFSANLGHALAFFFGPPSDQPNSFLFSALGFAALPFALLLFAKRVRAPGTLETPRLVAFAFLAGLLAQAAFLMSYSWGRFDDPVMARLSLPAHLALSFSLLLALPEFRGGERPRWFLVCAAALSLLAVSIPSMATHAYSQQYLPSREIAWKGRFLEEQARKDFLAIDLESAFWVTQQVPVTTVARARANPALLQFHLRNRSYSAMYVFQQLQVDPAGGKAALDPEEDLGPAYELETVAEERLRALTISRVSRIVGIRSDKGEQRAETPLAEVPPPKNVKAAEAAREAYMKNFIRQLP